MKRKTLVFVYHSMDVGGAEKELLAYVSHLDSRRYSVHLALTRMKGELLPSIPHYVQRHLVPGDSHKPNGTYLINLYRTLSAIKPDAVIGFMQDVCFNILLLRLLTPLRFKTIISEQVVLSQWQMVVRTPWIKKKLIKLLYQKADAYFAQSESIMDDLEKKFGIDPARLYLIPSFVPQKTLGPASRIKKGISSLSKYFLYVGRLAPEKNIDTLLHAFRRVHQVHRFVHLLIVGPHTTTYFDSICVRLGIRRAVRFIGYTDSPGTYYHHALALIIPSFVEGRSRVMVEAMIAGCPVIASDFPGHHLYIKHRGTGIVFHKNSIDDLEHCMTYALHHPNVMRKIAKQAHHKITNEYINTHYLNYRNTINNAIENVVRNSSATRR